MFFCTKVYADHVKRLREWPTEGDGSVALGVLVKDFGVVRAGQEHRYVSIAFTLRIICSKRPDYMWMTAVLYHGKGIRLWQQAFKPAS
jgi:hypothetical protein